MNEQEVKEHLPEITVLSTELNADAMVGWTDEKRKDFVSKFTERARTSRYIAVQTAHYIMDKAQHKQFISQKHVKPFEGFGQKLLELQDRTTAQNGWQNYLNTIGSRPISELNTIAEEKADEILSNLPPLKKAVEILSPEISKAIEDRDKLLEKGKLLFEQAEELSGQLDMADVDQNMTVAEFRMFVKERNRKRRDILSKLDDVTKDAQALDTKINKFLYSGLPGLSQAVVDIITELLEKSTAFGALNRRVEEKVMFGDSSAAVTLLQSFEKDELKVSQGIKSQFDQALEQLKLAGQKKAKQAKQLKGK
jgi:hypothetical protein